MRGGGGGTARLPAAAQKNQPTVYTDVALLFAAEPRSPAAVQVSKGHGRLERREVRVCSDLAGYSLLPGLAQAAEVRTRVVRLATGEVSDRVRYLVTSLDAMQADPQQVLALSRGHWGIENRLFHVTDDSFGEDRHVLQSHAAGTTLSLPRTAALNLLRGQAPLWTAKTPLTARAEWVNAHPSAILAAVDRL